MRSATVVVPVREVRPDGTTTYEWDQLGSVVRRTAPGSLVTTRTLDLMNQVTTEAAPLLTTARELTLTLGHDHGLLYRPYPEWLEPAARWARGGTDAPSSQP